MKNSLKIAAAASLSLLAAACAQFDTAGYKPNPDSITFAAETAANPGLLASMGATQTPNVTEFPSAPKGTLNVNSMGFAAETASDPDLLPSLGMAITPNVSQFGEYIPDPRDRGGENDVQSAPAK